MSPGTATIGNFSAVILKALVVLLCILDLLLPDVAAQPLHPFSFFRYILITLPHIPYRFRGISFLYLSYARLCFFQCRRIKSFPQSKSSYISYGR